MLSSRRCSVRQHRADQLFVWLPLNNRHYELLHEPKNEASSNFIPIKCFNNGADKAEVTMYDPSTKQAKARLTLEYSKNNGDGERPVLRHHIRAF